MSSIFSLEQQSLNIYAGGNLGLAGDLDLAQVATVALESEVPFYVTRHAPDG